MALLELLGLCALLQAFPSASSAIIRQHIDIQHDVHISNDSGEQVIVDWINPLTGEDIEFSQLPPGETLNVNSFTNHSFVLRFQNDTCDEEHVCRRSIITISDNDDQVVKVKKGLELEYRDSSTKANYMVSDIVQGCKDDAKRYLAAGYNKNRVMEQMLSCIEDGAVDTFESLHEAEKFEESLRLSISFKKENYTCKDPTMETTKAKAFRQWNYKNVTRRVHLLHDRKASKIHLLENFISPEECAAIQETAEPVLRRGTVADGKGGSKLSEHRKALQAGIRIPFEKGEYHPIVRVFRRIYAYTNNATGFDLDVDGAEDIMSIQYKGEHFKRGEAPDRYMPHCDGDCAGLPLKMGGRVATMVMYCTADDLVGGGTHFGNANVFVKPEVGAAAFFSYLDPETHIHETGWTSHSGCPVVEGVKRIAVHWMRMGVDKDHPWDSFNTLNIRKSECEDDD